MSQHESIYFDSCEQKFEHLIFFSSFSFHYIGEGQLERGEGIKICSPFCSSQNVFAEFTYKNMVFLENGCKKTYFKIIF